MDRVLTPPDRPVTALLGDAWDAGIRFRWDDDGQLRIAGLRRQQPLLRRLADRRDDLAALLQPGAGESVRLGGRSYPYLIWSGSPRWLGEQLGGCFALDTETTMAEPGSIPELVMATASDGQQHLIIHPQDFGAFIRQHAGATICAHNAAFDWRVIHQHLSRDPIAQELWWQFPDSGRLRDTMLLDSLYQLAKRDTYPRSRDLGTLANYYVGLTIDKSDPCRQRYGDIIGQDWTTVPRCFFDYAVSDAIATYQVYTELIRRVRTVEADYQIDAATIQRHGHLTETIQVQAAIALAAIERTGLDIDRRLLDQLRSGLQQQREELLQRLDEAVPDLFVRDKHGRLKLSSKGAPRKRLSVLLPMLQAVADEAGIVPPSTATGRIQTAADFWQQFDSHPLIGGWLQLEELTKLLSFFAGLDSGHIHPRYSTMVRTGRTSCSSPNVQQLPRSGRVREAIIAPEGRSFYAVDYAFIELRTLAAVCEQRYGWSQLADTIRAGIDPHCFVAAMFEHVTLEEFMSWKQSQPQRFKQLRQRAKALNFGIPGGLGARTLVAYAAATYNVELTIEQAEQFRTTLITEVFPELGRYLSEDDVSIVARQLQCTPEQVRQVFNRPHQLGTMRRIIKGETTFSDGRNYSDEHIAATWAALSSICCNPELQPLIDARDTSDDTGLARKLFGAPVMTSTGRIRGRVNFTASRNTPFQGLAADGAKLAMYQLIRNGYTVHAFIHDEFLLSLPDDADWIAEPKRIDRIICDAMASVCGTIPIEAEGARMRRWYKSATAVYDEDGTLLPYEEKQDD